MLNLRLIFLLLCLTHLAFSQENKDQNLQNVRLDVIYLASNYLEGRETGKMGEKLAAEYLASRFGQLNVSPKGAANTYFQDFDFEHFPDSSPNQAEPRTGTNIIGFIDNNASTTVVLGAHYDHIGYGTFGSKMHGEPAIHNGADDNASGVALLLYLGEKLSALKQSKNNYLLVAFSGEEMGLHGSKHFIENPTIDLESINFMINLNMVGKLAEDHKLIINGVGTSPGWKESFPRIEFEGIEIKTTDNGIGASDHNAFYFANIPAIHVTTGSHQDYHTPNDDSEFINFAGICTIGDYLLELLQQMNRVGKLPFTPTMNLGDTPAPQKYKVTLGVKPNYNSMDGGVLIDGVIDGRPAQKAGIQVGDIIIQIGDLKVNSIYDYMDGLGLYNPGESGSVVIKRGNKKMELEIQF